MRRRVLSLWASLALAACGGGSDLQPRTGDAAAAAAPTVERASALGSVIEPLAPGKAIDFDGDRISDLLWHNAATGQTVIWLMNGAQPKASAVVLTHPDFRAVATPDLDGDGRSDIVWHNALTGQTTAWLMNGLGARAGALLLADPNFKVAATPDLDGDGRADLVWHNAASGQTTAWLMNGLVSTAGTLLLSDAQFKLAATPDLNGDGRADLLWHNATTGQTSAWLMNGLRATAGALLLTDAQFKVVATPDMDGDRRSDLVWHNAATGQTTLWLMNGLAPWRTRLLLADANFKLAATADLDGNGRADLVWHNAATGQTAAWLTDGWDVVASAVLLTHPGFRVTATGHLDADGRADLLWYDPTSGETVAWLMNGLVPRQATRVLRDPNFRLADAITVGGGSDSPAGGWNLSGSIGMPEYAAVDADTNDPMQPNRRDNDSLGQAQSFNAPLLLIGSVNEAYAGETGPNYSTGDEYDIYRVSLQAGQVIELEFAADPSDADIDLYVLDGVTQQVIGDSIGTNRYECILIGRAGQHYVAVNAYSGASIYNLRIGAPGDGTTCANVASSRGSLLANRVMARAKDDAGRGNAVRTQALAAGGVSGADTGRDFPTLLRLPEQGAERRAALQRMALLDGNRASALGGAKRPAPRMAGAAAMPAEAMASIETVHYAKTLARSGGFAYVEPDRRVEASALLGAFPPDDRNYPSQRWHYEMIRLPAAMDRLLGLGARTNRPLVAVIDTGVMLDHIDLAPQLDASGWDFVLGVAGGDDPASGYQASFHGSHVAGTVAASTFDGVGAAGVAPMAQLLALRVLGLDGSGSSYDIVQAILYAAGLPNASGRTPPRRADVVNMSLGGSGSCSAGYQDAISRAMNQGVIVVAASGNESRNDLGYATPVGQPANCTGVISVGSLDARRQQAWYSNGGDNLVVAAPGGDTGASTTGRGEPDGVFSTIGGFDAAGARRSSYAHLQGTSMASPHVAGVMALMRYANPAITPAQVATLFTQGKLTVDVAGVGRDRATGWGLIDARKAVDAALDLVGAPQAPVGVVVANPSSLDFGTLRTSAELDLALTGPSSERVLAVSSNSAALTVTAASIDPTTRLGRYTVTLNRQALPVGSSYAAIQVTTTSRYINIGVAMQRSAGGGGADFGRIYVLLIDPATGDVLDQVDVAASQGRYAWSYNGLQRSTVQIVAGTDVNNDGYICDGGEACGAYPTLGAPPLTLERHRSDLDFRLVPLGGIGTAAQGSKAGYARPAAGRRR